MLNVSQTELADAVGVTFQQIQKYESGTNRVAATRLLRIAVTLKTDIRHLLDDTGVVTVNDVPLQKFLSTKSGITLCRVAMKLKASQLNAVINLARSL